MGTAGSMPAATFTSSRVTAGDGRLGGPRELRAACGGRWHVMFADRHGLRSSCTSSDSMRPTYVKGQQILAIDGHEIAMGSIEVRTSMPSRSRQRPPASQNHGHDSSEVPRATGYLYGEVKFTGRDHETWMRRHADRLHSGADDRPAGGRVARPVLHPGPWTATDRAIRDAIGSVATRPLLSNSPVHAP